MAIKVKTKIKATKQPAGRLKVKTKIKATKQPAGRLRLDGFDRRLLGKKAAADIDLTPHAGRHVRIWLDVNGAYSTDPSSDHLWQMAELTVPEPEYEEIDTEERDPDGNIIKRRQVLPLDLSRATVETWPLPE